MIRSSVLIAASPVGQLAEKRHRHDGRPLLAVLGDHGDVAPVVSGVNSPTEGVARFAEADGFGTHTTKGTSGTDGTVGTMDEEVETWLPVPDWEYYEVSDLGGVRSIDRVTTQRTGRKVRLRGRVLAPVRKDCGHLKVTLCAGERRQESLVHHLVLAAFAGPRPDGLECLHGNDVPDDNRLSNIRWGTRSENQQDRVRSGSHHETRKATCPYRHLLAPPNLVPSTARQGHRRCRACARAVSSGGYAKKMGYDFDVRAEADRQYDRLLREFGGAA